MIEETASVFVGLEEGLDTFAQLLIISTRAFDKSGPLFGREELQRSFEYLFFAINVVVHGRF